MTRPAGILIALLLTLPAPTAAQDGLAEKSERLEALREQIDAVKAELAEDRARRDDVTDELARLEKRLGELAAGVDTVERRLADKRERVASLKAEIEAESRRLEHHRRYLREQIRAAYASGREEYLRLLLNQEEPERLDRILVYYDYLNAARSERISEAVTALEELAALRRELRGETEALAELRRERAGQLEALQARRAEREALLERLGERISDRDSRLAALRADAERLQDLVGRLQRRLADIPEDAGDDRPFADRKGELAWPLAGPLIGQYGRERSGNLRWAGLLIGADAGEPVHAAAGGRVVFSDWLRGLGLLLIIDHGDGYLTLYGHNQSVYSEAGDWVAAGEVVATVGASGGRDRAALYFEVRSGGEPVDPMAWLGPRPDAG